MYNNSNHGWAFQNNNNSNNIELNEPLREPVAFEDFQFSLGLDPNFAMPIQLDIPPTSSNNFSFISPPTQNTNTCVLNEQDQKAFSQFLDQFYVDPNMQIDPQPFSLYNSAFDEEHARQSNILHSLDAQKKTFREKPTPVFLEQNRLVPTPTIARDKSKHFNSSASQQAYSVSTCTSNSDPTCDQSSNNKGGGPIRRGKSNKELLTEEEKRSNHIASEQKRRGMIRTGFKDLTEIVPTLKNINNSKSTVLFKAVDYIKYLEKRNKNLREKIKNLEVRAEVEGRMGGLGRPPNQSSLNSSSTQTALLQHKTQQRQLYELQEKLHHHQKLITQQNRFGPSNNSTSFWHNENTNNEYEDIVSA